MANIIAHQDPSLSEADRTRLFLQQYEGVAAYRVTDVSTILHHSPCKTTAIITGNQFGKGETVIRDYYLRLRGNHPNKYKNITDATKIRVLRFASEVKPGGDDESEVVNTQYPVMKRRFPPYWITKDITSRNNVVSIMNEFIGSKPVQIEYVSYNQSDQSQAGQQRLSTWLDEISSRAFLEEQMPRLLVSDGDLILSLTPTGNSSGWEFDYIYERARIIYRMPSVREFLFRREGKVYPAVEKREGGEDIMVIMAATDDNPIYEELAAEKSKRTGKLITVSEYIESALNLLGADPDIAAARRYGLFTQLSGKIYKQFDKLHVIDRNEYFPTGIPTEYIHFRGIDYHQRTPWAFVWIMVSPADEIFVVADEAYDPGKLRTYDIAEAIARQCGDYKFRLDLIDPLANTSQSNTGRTTVQDLNDDFRVLKKMDVSTGAYWQGWDTKNTRGREELTKRLINSIKCGKPFNNKQMESGRAVQLPTIWFFNNCKYTIPSFQNWRHKESKSKDVLIFDEEKEKGGSRWSHHPVSIECLLKRPEVSMARWPDKDKEPRQHKNYFKSDGRNIW